MDEEFLAKMRRSIEAALDASRIELDDRSDDYCDGFDAAHTLFYQRVMRAVEALHPPI